MGFFSFNQEIAIDLGTANTIILYNDKIVVDAPSMVALDNRTGKLKAVGHEAQAMYGRAPENIRVIRPLQNGVIADFNAAEQMIGKYRGGDTCRARLVRACGWPGRIYDL